MGLSIKLKGKKSSEPKKSAKLNSKNEFGKSNIATLMGAFMGMCVAFAFSSVISAFMSGLTAMWTMIIFAVVSAIFGLYWFKMFRKE